MPPGAKMRLAVLLEGPFEGSAGAEVDIWDLRAVERRMRGRLVGGVRMCWRGA